MNDQEDQEDQADCYCGNCEWTGTVQDLGKSLHQIHKLASRLDPGYETPVGECGECGALAYLSGYS